MSLLCLNNAFRNLGTCLVNKSTVGTLSIAHNHRPFTTSNILLRFLGHFDGKRRRTINNGGEEVEYPKRIPIAADFKQWKWHDPEIDVKVIPSNTELSAIQYYKSIKYFRRMYAKYGRQSGVNPCLLWPTANEINRTNDEQLLEESIETILAKNKAIQTEKESEKAKLHDIIQENKKKLPEIISRLRKQRALERERALISRTKKQHFLAKAEELYGYRVNPDSPKFQLLLEILRREEKRSKKNKIPNHDTT